MPSSFSCYTPRGLFLSKLQKFIPKAWKQETKQHGRPPTSCNSIEATVKTRFSNEPMIDSLLTSLKKFASHGELSKAFETFSHIQLHRGQPGSSDSMLHAISALLFFCAKFKFLPQGRQLHGHIILLGFEQHPIYVPKLVTFYSSFNLLAEAHTITENSIILHPLAWNLLIFSYVKNDLFSEALAAYKEMLNKGIRPDNFTYPSVIKACAENLDFSFGKEVHSYINANSTGWSLFVHNALISMYGRFGEVGTARHLFDNMPEKDTVSWNSIISSYASRSMSEEAFELFERMQMEGIEANNIIWNTIAGCCLRVGNFTRALQLISQMRTVGIHLDFVSMITGLGACSHLGVIKLGREIHGFVIHQGYDRFDNVQNALITMYARCNDLRHAYDIFQMVKEKSIITWNSMLSGYAHMDRLEEALFLFREILLSGIEPNYVTIASILSLCARVGDLQHGREFHCYITKRGGFEEYLSLWNALVDMYARSGKVLEAKRLFDSMTRRDEVTYTSLISGYGMQGGGHSALKLYEEMNRLQIKPDHITMIAVLSACSHSGLVSQGQMLFERMQTVHGISPRLEHYACMVDLFGRAGLINKARKIITEMHFKPTSDMWATLVGACHIHRNSAVGEWAAEKLLEMKPENPGYYVLIANMYASAGCWSKLAQVRTYMRDLGVAKAPGCAWVDMGYGFVPFLVGDTSNPQASEIHLLLDGLNELMRDSNDLGVEDFGLSDEAFL